MDQYEALKYYFGHSQFRQGQEALIDAILSGRDVLGIMPTGGGKSLCYQIPALVFDGVTLVISPLISLMKDQVAALSEAGIQAAYLNSTLTVQQMELGVPACQSGGVPASVCGAGAIGYGGVFRSHGGNFCAPRGGG